MIEIFLYVVILLLGASLAYFRPIARATKIPIYWEIGAGSLLIIFVLFQFTSSGVNPGMSDEDLAKKPCGDASPQGACYNLEHSVCESAWANSEAICKAEVANIVKSRPGALTGPIMNRCRARKMDQFLRYNRVNEGSPFCKAYFDFIEAK